MTPEQPSDPETLRLELPTGPVFVTDRGRGAPILALHGLPGTVRDFRWLGAALEPKARFIRVDLPGFGQTPLRTGPGTTIPGRAEVIPWVLDALELSQVTLVGHSMGGPVALAAATRWPERCSGLALLSSVGLQPHRLIRRTPGSGLIAHGMQLPLLGRAITPLYRRLLRAVGFRGRYSDQTLLHLARCIAAVSFETIQSEVAALDRLQTPTLAAWAEDDPFLETEIFVGLAAALPAGPRLAFATGGHNIQKTRALELADALLAFAG